MIDTNKYEGHTPAPWNTDCAEPDAGLIANIDAHDRTVARMVNGCLADTQLLADAPLILAEYKKLRQFARLSNYSFSESLPELMQALVDERAEVKRLRKLEAAVVGSWMETINRGSSWHKQLRDPCVELGYLTYDDCYELPKKYQDMAKEWVKEYYGDDEE